MTPSEQVIPPEISSNLLAGEQPLMQRVLAILEDSKRIPAMLRSAVLASALATIIVGGGEARATPNGDNAQPRGTAHDSNELLAQGDGGGSGGSGDSAGRGPSTSKGAVPAKPPQYPSGMDSPGTAAVPPSPADPMGKPAIPEDPGPTKPGTTMKPGSADTPAGTGMRSPGTTQQGGGTRTDH